MKFLKRWVIEGTLTTWTPLRIGDGDTTERSRLKNKDGFVQIASVATDARERTHVPASTLKSRVKGWAQAGQMPKRTIEVLFGSDDPEDEKLPNGQIQKSLAGKVEFDNSPATEKRDFAHAPPHWCEKRWTGVAAAVTIGRRTRAARDERLFHQEYVPPGISYHVTLRVQDTDSDEGVAGDDGIVQLLAAMEGFNICPHGVTLGSASEDGWGAFHWQLGEIKYIDCEGVKQWLAKELPTSWRDALTDLAKADVDEIRVRAQHAAQTLAGNQRAGSVPTLYLQLACQDDFLVNDPSRTKAFQSADEKAPNHAPLRDIDGNPILPRRSARGAFRAQAERILRTFGGETAACHADDPHSPCQRRAIKSITQVSELCLACRVFGAPGWRSPFRISAFVAERNNTGEHDIHRRDFIAVDRFKQGVAAGLKQTYSEGETESPNESAGMKFDADVVHRPVLTGSVGIDLKALQHGGIGNWAIGLLALTLRDLVEGDIRIGFGRGKGFGDIVARVTGIAPPDFEHIPALFQTGLTGDDLTNLNPQLTRAALSNVNFGNVLRSAVDDLHRVIAERAAH